MSETDASFASEPITPRGVAAFAHAHVGRLWLVQLVAASLVAVAVLWFFNDSCAPTIAKAIRNLEDSGEIHTGELSWTGASPQVLAEERVLAFDIDLNHSGRIHCISDVQVEFGRDSIRIFFTLPDYYVDIPYPYNPADQVIPISRDDLEPLWGAWLVEIQAILVLSVVVVLLVWWTVLATVYWLPVWLVGWLTDRELGLLQSWRLAGASLLPGALLLALGIFLYDFGVLDLVQFTFVFTAHLLMSWLYLFVSLLFLPRREVKAVKKNPFETDGEKKSEGGR